MDDCLFCKIIKGEIPSTKVYSDDYIYAFKDIHPVAPIHHLIVPRDHHDDILTLQASGDAAELMVNVLNAVEQIAKAEGIYDRGFRLVNNCREEGGQTVMHLHFHMIGGQKQDESRM